MNSADLFTHSPPRSAMAASTGRRSRGKRVAFLAFDGEGGDPRTISPAGRDAWALDRLILAGPEGCTPLEHVGPRWSHYVWKLRTVYRLDVETITEPHGGDFAGHHARYVLRTRVAFADPADAAAHAAEARP
jgi:hypothetical protein